MKKLIKTIAVGLLLGATGINLCGMKRGRENEQRCLSEFGEKALQIGRCLFDAGKDVNFIGEDGFTQLHRAAMYGLVYEVEVLLKSGADVNKIASANRTPLHMAAYYGKIEIVDILLRAGADKNIIDAFGKKPLDWALRNMHKNVIERLQID